MPSLFLLAALVGCASSDDRSSEAVIVLGAYTTPREAYGEAILPAFQAHWSEKTGQKVRFEESYQGSGAQSRAVVGGFEADVVALSLEPDVDRVERAGLITRDWKAGPHGGMVSRSVVVIAVRPGNPKGIRDWADLARPGVEVLTPNVKTSGGAMWNVAAAYGAAERTGGDGEALLAGILANVRVMDKGARESLLSFERGIGDAAITYENEVLVAKAEGLDVEYVVPPQTLLVENPVAVVDRWADEHGAREVADAFVAYLHGPEAQEAYARYGLRRVDGEIPPGAFTIADLGGWDAVQATLFGDGGAYDRATERARR